MSLADGMINLETRVSNGFCVTCHKMTDALWERFGKRLSVSCEECGTIIINDENYFKEKGQTNIPVDHEIAFKNEEDDLTDEAIDNQGDIDDDFNERSEGIEKSGHGPMAGYF